MQQQHQHHPSDEDDQRRNRFINATTPDTDRDKEQRAVSQPPHNSNGHAQNLISPSQQQQQQQQHQQSQQIATSSPWSTQPQQRTSAGRPMPMPMSQIPTHSHPRSSSFSHQNPSHFSSAVRDARTFPSTFEAFEDDEEGELRGLEDTDTYDERYFPPSQFRGRTYASDLTRNRSQSLATTSRPGPIGSPLQSSALWESPASASSSGPLNIPSAGGRYGDIKPPVGTNGSRYGSLGTPLHQNGYSTAAGTAGSGTIGSSSSGGGGSSGNGAGDISNMSPFVRDVGQILLDDGNAFRELWAGMNPPRDEIGGGGGSGTTSRRHSVSVVQPRRGPPIVGFNVPGQGQQGQGQGGGGGEEATITTRPSVFHTQSFGRGGLMLSDDDLASDLGQLNLNLNEGPGPVSSGYGHPPSQPASLPIYAPLSRSPVSPSSDRLSPYQSINLAIPSSVGAGSSYPSSSRHHPIGSPSESGLSAGSPARSSTHSQFDPDAPYPTGGQQHPTQGQGQLTARFIPGQGIQYLPQTTANGMGYAGSSSRTTGSGFTSTGLASSPTSTRTIQPQQQPYYPHHALHHQQQQQQPMNRRSSIDASSAPLAELGKGVPLHSVPASWPLYIVEFKAGRTDLFYLTDLSLDIRVGDLVIVEADRGKDLGKVVNDSITLKEVEEFQREQMARVGYGDGQPTSPGGAGSGASGSGTTAKKEINPKMIYGKAQGQDTQLLIAKIQDEVKALQLCQSKVRQKKLPMEVIDAEYQWDRRKLTFYFVAEKRIDFRELVRELFRLYKTRIWMASLQGPTYDQ